MMTEQDIIDTIEERLDVAEGKCNRTWFDHNDGVVRGLLWALTGKDPGFDLFNRTDDIYKLIGARIKYCGDHFHYALPGCPDSDMDKCDICDGKK